VGALVVPDDPAAGAPAAPARPAASPALDAEVRRLSRFVAAERRLPFRRPVRVQLLGDREFETEYSAGEAGETEQDVADTLVAPVALGLLDPAEAAEFADVGSAADADTVAGFYDSKRDRLYVRGTTITPAVRATLVHELTHALDDQHFNLDRPDLWERDDEAGPAFDALVEGSATYVEERYLESLPAAERRQVEEAEERAAGAGAVELPELPELFLTYLAFPYEDGREFVDTLVGLAGWEALNEAFRRPPVSTERLLDATYFLDGEPPLGLADPVADGTVIDRGPVGELDLLLLLDDRIDEDEAFDAAEGWGNGRYVAWRDGTRSCTRQAWVMDSARDRRELRAALTVWVRHATELTASLADGPDGALELTSCR
jgi:hypothetical protein